MPKVLRHIWLALVVGLSGQWSESVYADSSSFTSAAQSYRQGEWHKATVGFSNCLSDQHLRTAARFYLAECQMQLGEYAQAKDSYLKVLAEGDDSLEARALFRSGEADFLSGDAASARISLQRFVDEHAHNPSAAYAFSYLGDLALKAGDASRAAAAFRKVIDSYPQSSRVAHARIGLARSLLILDRADQVSIALGRLTESKDVAVVAEAYLLLGRAAFESGEYEEGLKQFRKVWQHSPMSPLAPRARLAAAWSLWQLERFDEISEEISPLFREARWVADYHYLLGMAAYGKGQWKRGSEQLGAAIAAGKEHPNFDAMLFYRGECCFQDSRYEDARHSLNQLVEQHSQSSWLDDALWGLVQIAQSEKDPAAYQRAIDRLQQRAPKSDYMARLQEKELRPKNIEGSLKQETLLDEAAGFQRDGRRDAALAVYHELIAKDDKSPFHAEALLRGANLHLRLHQHREAKALYKQLLVKYPYSTSASEALAALAEIHDRADEAAKAKVCREELVEKFPQSPQAPEAAYRLAHNAADERDRAPASEYVGWLLDELDRRESLTKRQQQLWAQAVCLQCQLAATEKNWHVVQDVATDALPGLPQGDARARIEFWLAEAEFRTGRPEEARTRFAQLDPRTVGIGEEWIAMVPLRRAQLAARRQQWAEVLKLVERIEHEHPDFQLQYEIDYLHGRALAGKGEMTAAREAYGRVLNNKDAHDSETIVMAQWMIGETFFHQQNYVRARAAYLAVIEQPASVDWQSRAALQIGKCWELEDRWDEARTMYEQALQRWPGSEPEPQLHARLKWAESRTNPRR